MNTNFKIAVAVVAGAALGAAAMQGLHAQAKLKAYSVTEVEVLDPAALAVYTPLSRLRSRVPVAALSILPEEGLSHSPGRLPGGWASSSGTALSRRKHSLIRQPLAILRRSAIRQKNIYGSTPSKPPRIRLVLGVAPAAVRTPKTGNCAL